MSLPSEAEVPRHVHDAVPAALSGERLDRAVALVGEISRGEAARLVEGGQVQVNGEVVKRRSLRLDEGDVVSFTVADEATASPAADAAVAVHVVYEDSSVIVVEKPAGLVVHPGSAQPSGTLVNGLLARYPELSVVGDPQRPGIVHRLDQGTSGLLVIARTVEAYHALGEQLRERQVQRRYEALVWGSVEEEEGIVDAPVGRSRRHRTRMAVRPEGREARTRYRVVERFSHPAPLTRLACSLETGRTHQIRVHLAAIGHPVVGDTTYGSGREALGLQRPFLHAATLGFRHPLSGEWLELESPLPPELDAVLRRLRESTGPSGGGP